MKTRSLKFRAWDGGKMRDPYTNYGYKNINHAIEGADGLLMQFAGFVDKDGVEIFEGDILQVRLNSECHSERDVVGVAAGCWMWRTYPVSSIAYASKIIGNIHEHPHLL